MSENDQLSLKKCPRCGASVPTLLSIDTGMKVALQTAGGAAEGIPDQACSSCYDQLTGRVSQGVRLRIEQETREKNKVMLWKNRVNLIKQARSLMQSKAYSEAALSYEKYIKILEMVYSCEKGQLSPDIFNKSSRSKELTVIASVYWDLMRIYDMSPRYGNRMQVAADKLALFVGYSTIYPDIMAKAEAFEKTAKNPQVVRSFLKKTKKNRPNCFVATVAFQAPLAPEVQTLRRFRDQRLKQSAWGRWFIIFYYKNSPSIADWLSTHPRFRKIIRFLLKKVADRLDKTSGL